MIRFVMLFACFISLSAVAVEEDYPFEDTQQAKVFRELVHELRCPKCQNQNIADSNAMVAIDLKNKTYQLVTEGKSKQQVVDFMVERYGQFVHYDPPINFVTSLLWGGPVLFVLGLVVFIVFKNKRTVASPNHLSQQSIEQAERILSDLKGKE